MVAIRATTPARGGSLTLEARVGEPVEPTDLEVFLTARWGLHSHAAGRTWWTPNQHPPWPLHTAEVLHLDEDLVHRADSTRKQSRCSARSSHPVSTPRSASHAPCDESIPGHMRVGITASCPALVCRVAYPAARAATGCRRQTRCRCYAVKAEISAYATPTCTMMARPKNTGHGFFLKSRAKGVSCSSSGMLSDSN